MGVRSFVRDQLGCGCPETVFDDIRIYSAPAGFGARLPLRLLEIGGRLMILIVGPDQDTISAGLIRQLLADGVALRDERGFNRFRLVVASLSDPELLLHRFTGIPCPDERAHLHVVSARDLPDLA